MATYDQGGGCACGLYKVCVCQKTEHWRTNLTNPYRWTPPVKRTPGKFERGEIQWSVKVPAEPTSKWIGVDLDGTLFVYLTWGPPCDIGEPIPPMVQLVKQMLARGKDVRIFTARAFELDGTPVPSIIAAIEAKCLEHLGKVLPITNRKDYACQCIFDDRAVTVQSNTGRWYAWNGLVEELEKSNVFDFTG